MASSTTSSPNANEQQSFPISHLSAINVSNFISSKLRGDKISNNYSSWKEQMLCLIESQDLLQFIQGKIDDGKRNSEGHIIIQRTDRLVEGWILGALDDGVLKNVANFTTARDVWLELEMMFSTVPGQVPQETGKELHNNLPLYKAALRGDWNEAKAILEQDPNAMGAKLNSHLQTALHIAVGTEKAIDFVKELVHVMPNDLLGLKDYLGYTALHVAAQTGNTKAAKILVDKRPDLLHERNDGGDFPVHIAGLSAHVETLKYFVFQTKDDSPYLDETSGIKLLCIVIDAKILDVALHLAEKYPYLATVKLKDGNCALKSIALQTSAFCRDPIIRWFYNIDHEDRTTTNTSDIEGLNHPENRNRANNDSSPEFKSLYDTFHYIAYSFISVCFSRGYYLDPVLVKRTHKQAIKLVKCLCKNMEPLDYCKASAIYEDAILTAARSGIHEIIEEIIATFPAAIYTRSIYTKQSIFHVAAENRHRQVFDLINLTRNLKYQMPDMTDFYGNTILHLAARLGSPQKRKLNHVIGAALQMQHEILWFNEIASFLQPHLRAKRNRAGNTAWMVFTEEHATLKAEGEKWVKDTAQACSIVAALIATVTFAAAITIPGGIDSNNTDINKKIFPLFLHKSAFKAFTWFNIVSFFTSITSLFLFLSSNISLYAEENFLINLPVKPILNLSILFASVASMTGAFTAAMYLLLKDRNTIIVFSILLLYLLFPAYLFLAEYVPLTTNVLVKTAQLFFKPNETKDNTLFTGTTIPRRNKRLGD